MINNQIKQLLVLFLLFILNACKPEEVITPLAEPGTLVTIDLAKTRKFVQRNEKNEGEVLIVGNCSKPITSAKVKFKNYFSGQETEWLNLIVDESNGFKGTFTLKGGGYYPQVVVQNNGQVLKDTLLPQNFKVGEIFAVIGHSLAEGQSPYTITAYDQQWCEIIKWPGTNGIDAFWGRFADKLRIKLQVPIMVYNTGIGGSNSYEWGQSAYGLEFQSPLFDWKKRFPYSFFEDRVNNDIPKTGIRAILVMHGENDYALAENQIVESTRAYIEKTRDLLNAPKLTFLIAKSNTNINIPEVAKVKNAQKRMLTEISFTYLGADLETISGSTYRWDSIHFNFAGLEEAANRWNDVMTPEFFQQTKPYFRSN